MRGPGPFVILGLLGGCGSHEAPPLVRPVQTTVAHYGAAGERVTLATLLTLVFLPARYVAWFRIREHEPARVAGSSL